MASQFNGFRATRPVARLIDAGKVLYEVFFIVYDGANIKHVKRFKAGINSLPVAQRKAQARAHAEVLWEAMHNGWHPLHQKYPQFKEGGEAKRAMHFDEALSYAVEQKRKVLSRYSMYDYDGCVRFIKKAALATGHKFNLIADIKRRDIKLILNEAMDMNNWSCKTRNKHLAILRSLLTVLEDDEFIEFNPAKKIKDLPVGETIGYATVTDNEKNRIADHLLLNAPDFFEYLMMIYDDGIRRKETLLLQVRDFNLARAEITIRAEVAKTNCERVVPITQTIMQILLRRQIWTLPPNWYVFSNNKFQPGPVAFHPNTPTNWWRTMVIDKKTGLGIDCKMYSLKHRGADDKILSGVDLDALRNLYGHKSKQMTEGYARAVKGKYKQEIIDKAPVFAKVIEMKKKAQ